MTKSLQAVAYARYSSDNQREESIDAQLRAIKEYCERNNYILLGTYTDEAKTATNDNRPNFQRLIDESERGLFNVVVVHKLDRFARNRYDSAIYKQRLKKNGVHVESVVEHLDDSPESIILESVLEGMAEYYSKNLARETRKGLMENAIAGKHTGGRPPYGFKVNPETLKFEIDERAAPAVKIYFEGIAAGKTDTQIADDLNNRGYRTYTGRKFTKTSFWNWARNKKYKGVYTWDVVNQKLENGKRNSHHKRPEVEQVQIPGAIPAIISEELWNRVNEIMDSRKHKPGRYKAKLVYLLSDRVKCGTPACEGALRGSSYNRNGKRFAYYRCNANCGSRSIRKEELENIVIEKLSEIVFSDKALHNIVLEVKKLYQEKRKESEVNLQPVKNELAALTHKIDNWIDAVGEGILDRNVLAEKIREANIRRTALETELRRMELMQEKTTISEDAILKVMREKKGLLFSNNEEGKKRVIQEFVKSVTVQDIPEEDRFNVHLTLRLLTGVEDGT